MVGRINYQIFDFFPSTSIYYHPPSSIYWNFENFDPSHLLQTPQINYKQVKEKLHYASYRFSSFVFENKQVSKGFFIPKRQEPAILISLNPI